MSFPASYPGRCSECGLPFEEGDLIERQDDGWGHPGCSGGDAFSLRRGEVVCPECFLTPCGCDS